MYRDLSKACNVNEPGARNIKQSHNAQYPMSTAQKEAKRRRVGNNLADDILELCNRVAGEDKFVQCDLL